MLRDFVCLSVASLTIRERPVQSYRIPGIAPGRPRDGSRCIKLGPWAEGGQNICIFRFLCQLPVRRGRYRAGLAYGLWATLVLGGPCCWQHDTLWSQCGSASGQRSGSKVAWGRARDETGLKL